METTRTPSAAPKLTRGQLKSLICLRVGEFARGAPPAWHGWDVEKVRQWKEAMKEIRSDNTLPKIVAAAKIVIPAYGRDPLEIIPMEALQ